MEELLSRHRKERKEFQARSIQLKKQAQSDKKKKNELLAELHQLEEELHQRHTREVAELQDGHTVEELQGPTSVDEGKEQRETNEEHAMYEVEPKLNRQKLRKLRKEKEIEELRQRALEEPCVDYRSEELAQFQALLSRFQLNIHPIPANGHCLFNAIAHQLQFTESGNYSGTDLRKLAVDYMRHHQHDFIPFMLHEKTGEVAKEDDFDRYCSQMESTAVWGGHLEIQALAKALGKCIEVYQAASKDPIEVGDPQHDRLRISYHLHQYGLGQHYNSLLHHPH